MGERAWRSLKRAVSYHHRRPMPLPEPHDPHPAMRIRRRDGLRIFTHSSGCGACSTSMVFPWIPAVGDYLTLFGVIMVFSSSSVNMIANGLSPWAQALKQGGFCVVGCRRPADDDGSRFGVSQDQFHHAVRGDDAAGVDAHSARRGGQRQQGLDRHQERVHHTACGNRQAGIVRLDACELIRARKRLRKEGFLKAYGKLGLGYLLSLGLVMSGKDLGTCMIVLAIGAVALILGDFPGNGWP